MAEQIQELRLIINEGVENKLIKTSEGVSDCVESIKKSLNQFEQDLKTISEKSSNQKAELQTYQEKIDALNKEIGLMKK